MEVRKIRIDDFDYPLPEEKIALHPLEERDSCKLLLATPAKSAGPDRESYDTAVKIRHAIFSQLPLFLKRDTLIVANETKVIRARLDFTKPTGARIEIFLLEPLKPHDYVTNFASESRCSWTCLVGNRKRWKGGILTKQIGGTVLEAHMGAEMPGNGVEIEFSWGGGISFAEILEGAGNIPIPPYLNRESEERDTEDYQTVYSLTQGSVAAPTAGLHFTPGLIAELKEKGDEFATVTLHVGAGTFQPVKSEQIGDHPMHSEWISVSRLTLARIISALENGRDILAVGTTSVRTLESLPYLGKVIERGGTGNQLRVTQWMPYEKENENIDTIRALRVILEHLRRNGLDAIEAYTSIMIAPGFRWRIVNRLITNFHQPKSTLLLLVSSFLGGAESHDADTEPPVPLWRRIYDEALAEDYRFLSYGDACLFTRGPQPVELPASKSMAIRAATIYAAQTEIGQTKETALQKLDSLMNSGLCSDSEHYIKALKQTLASVSLPEDRVQEVYIGEGAAPLRFLTAFAASLPGAKIDISCAPGLMKRPLSPLVKTLRRLGADIEFSDGSEGKEWLLRIRGKKLEGGEVNVDSTYTSQYLSALMLASMLWSRPFIPEETQSIVSKPYVRMTRGMMADPHVEPDWSAAAFFYEYVLITGRPVDIFYLVPPSESLQGDSAACDIFAMLGVNTKFYSRVEKGSRNAPQYPMARLSFDNEAFLLARERGEFEFDFTDYPDMVPAVAVALCCRRLPFRFHGVGHLRYKECDRLGVLQTILVKLGYEVSVEGENLVFNGEFKPVAEFPVEIDPRGDHRMAMAFHPLELMGMVEVEDKDVVGKSFPDFYQQFK